MKKMANITNHQMTKEQKKDAFENLGIETFIELNESLKDKWGNIPPAATAEELQKVVAEFVDYVEGIDFGNTFCLVQGEMWMCYQLVRRLKEKGIRAFAATSARISKEETLPDGSVKKVNLFKHVQFREY